MSISKLVYLKMADVFKFKDKANNNNLVCDATPDAPRSENSNSVYDRPNLSQEDQQRKNEQNIPFINNNETSSTNSTSDKSDKPKSNGPNYSKPRTKKKSKPINTFYNIVNSENVKIGPTTVHTYNLNNFQNFDPSAFNRAKEQDKEELRQMLPHIQAFSKSKQVVTIEDMLLIKTHLGNGWKKVAKKIGFSKGEIDQFIEDYKHKGGIGEVIYKLLVAWKNAHTQDATIGQLIEAMWKSMEYECVEKLAMAHNIEA
ncbi:immune deficiency [Nasonia vitripennis]|uniref:Death domain-containing protein n=1 Tax=Nasonia vitripennis TaxID=7425 RepID=A0A7M6W8B2_NASVI|nr:immune deficiency [Nasonia vitripennis]